MKSDWKCCGAKLDRTPNGPVLEVTSEIGVKICAQRDHRFSSHIRLMSLLRGPTVFMYRALQNTPATDMYILSSAWCLISNPYFVKCHKYARHDQKNFFVAQSIKIWPETLDFLNSPLSIDTCMFFSMTLSSISFPKIPLWIMRQNNEGLKIARTSSW